MKKNIVSFLVVFSFFFWPVFMTEIVLAQDAAEVSPDSYKVLLDNERVRVLEYQISVGKKDEMHSHPAYVVYAITPGKFNFTFPDGKTMVREGKAGEVMFLEPETHSTENIGGAEAKGLIIELKEPKM